MVPSGSAPAACAAPRPTVNARAPAATTASGLKPRLRGAFAPSLRRPSLPRRPPPDAFSKHADHEFLPSPNSYRALPFGRMRLPYMHTNGEYSTFGGINLSFMPIYLLVIKVLPSIFRYREIASAPPCHRLNMLVSDKRTTIPPPLFISCKQPRAKPVFR